MMLEFEDQPGLPVRIRLENGACRRAASAHIHGWEPRIGVVVGAWKSADHPIRVRLGDCDDYAFNADELEPA